MFEIFAYSKAPYLMDSGPLCMNAETWKIGEMVYRLTVYRFTMNNKQHKPCFVLSTSKTSQI